MSTLDRHVTRRELLEASLRTGAALAGGRFFVTELGARQTTAAAQTLKPAFRALDEFVEKFMRGMTAPGMTLAVADRSGVLRTAAYGLGDVDRALPVQTDQLFEIGSITKSFVAIAILQLAEDGTIDLHRPIAEFMPWLKVDSTFRPITVHHLLTHGSGLPESLNCLLSDPRAALRPRYEPGEHFVYCNLGYQALGFLIRQASGRPFADVIRDRILTPIGMQSTLPVIDGAARRREPRSYNAWLDDRPFVPGAALKPAPPLIMDNAAGCIASTPHDMGLYIQMLANRGLARTRVLSDRSFELMTTPHIKADAIGPDVSYGYGLMIDSLDGHKVVRHTGGMVSFASALQVDVEEGIGVFASINAMQGFRPNPVAQYALRLLRASRARQPLPDPPAVPLPGVIANASELAGTFSSPSGKRLQLVADGTSLFVLHGGKKIRVESSGGQLIARDDELGRWPLNFQREGDAVTDLIHGGDWYAGERYRGPREFTYPGSWSAYVGHYRNDSPWQGSVRVVAVKGRLWLDGAMPLEPSGDAAFWMNDPPYNPGRVEFLNPVAGLCMHAKVSGVDYWRVMT